MEKRMFARVKQSEDHPPIIHSIGLPPQLNEGVDNREWFSWPSVLVIESVSDGAFMLYRYAEDQSVAGDTWHETFEDAIHQANCEYGRLLGTWKEIPEDCEDPVSFAFKNAFEQVKGDGQ